jgi:hypothetical protein
VTFGTPDWFSAGNLRKRQSLVAEVEAPAYGALGYFMHRILNPEPEPGPPYVHTFTLPQQPVYASSGKLVYRPPAHPAYTMEVRPVADVVREAGFGPVPQRIEVTYLTDETSAPASPYRSEVIQDTPLNGGCYWPMDDAAES